MQKLILDGKRFWNVFYRGKQDKSYSETLADDSGPPTGEISGVNMWVKHLGETHSKKKKNPVIVTVGHLRYANTHSPHLPEADYKTDASRSQPIWGSVKRGRNGVEKKGMQKERDGESVREEKKGYDRAVEYRRKEERASRMGSTCDEGGGVA